MNSTDYIGMGFTKSKMEAEIQKMHMQRKLDQFEIKKLKGIIDSLSKQLNEVEF